MDYALRVENLGKLYSINRGGSPSVGTVRERLARGVDHLLGRKSDAGIVHAMTEADSGAPEARKKEFWALKGVSFDVQAGERIGIIGANGAGKSTLLKILSRVTSPTEGRAEIRGKVASLLEVGTGFHPELSGRENIFLNGAILGMPRTEIRRKFDQIVDFSGVEKFIDTPVKHYSSGMYVRLAFSVSAWLDPDILILDEVLAVGDQGFQKRCEMRMKDLTKEGRTVIFVSHSMATINQMCQKALYLEHGRAVSFSSVQDATEEYEHDVIEAAGIVIVPPHERSLDNPADRGGTGEARVVELNVFGQVQAEGLQCITSGHGLEVEVTFEVLDDLPGAGTLDLAIGIDTAAGTRVFTAVSSWEGVRYPTARGTYKARIAIDDMRLRAGNYLLSLALINASTTVDSIVHCGAFRVSGTAELAGIPWRNEHGATRFPVNFSQ